MRSRAIHYLCGTAAVGAITWFDRVAFGVEPSSCVVMTYILGVVLSSMRLGYGVSLWVAVASVASYDFFFVPPRFSLAVGSARDLLTLAIMLFVAFVISNLTARLRAEAASAASRAEEVRRAHDRVETEKLRNALLSCVSHDLRSPLSVVQAAAAVLAEQDGALSMARRAELLQTISSEAHRLNRLVSNLVDATAIEAGVLEVKRDMHAIGEIIGVALGRLEHLLAARTVVTDVPAGLPLFPFDAALIEQVLVNLVENATKHTPPGSPITLAARRVDSGLEITVADRGAGIRPGDEERIFDRFYRGSQRAGMGLGLTICRGIVAAHGGAIRAEAHPGGGALFRVLLPTPRARQAGRKELVSRGVDLGAPRALPSYERP